MSVLNRIWRNALPKESRACVVGILVSLLIHPAMMLGADRQHQARRPEEIRVILQDIGDPLTRLPWPPTPEGLLSASIEPIADSAIDVYAYGLYHAGGVTHDSKAYQIIGDHIDVMHESSGLKMRAVLDTFTEQGLDPITIMCEGAHESEKDFWLRMRMNDLHDHVGRTSRVEQPTKKPKKGFLEPYYYTPQWKKDHPEWLIGDPAAALNDFSFEAFESGAPNYLHAPVREMMLAMATEAVENYDIDGFEIDFIRFPYFFPRKTAWVHRHVMTAFVRKLREVVDRQAARRGRPIVFSARVPDTVELGLRVGVDLETWFSEGLLDLCVVSGGYTPFSTSWEEITSLGDQHDILVLACLSNSVLKDWKWQRTEQGLQPEPRVQQKIEHVRAAAYRAYAQGVNGFELWNYFYEMPHYYSSEQREGVHYLGFGFTRDIADRQALAGMRKAYLLDYGPGLGRIFHHVCWEAQRPVMITPATDGIGQTVTFDVGDDLTNFRGARAQLWINIVDLFDEDRLEFQWNGERLAPRNTAYPGQIFYSNREFKFDIEPERIRHGENLLTLLLRKRTPRLEPFVTLNFARLMVDPAAQ